MLEFVVLSQLKGKAENIAQLRQAHLDYLRGLKDRGALVMAGRFTDGLGGLYILAAASLEEAGRMAEADPYHSSGLREFSIRGWERRL